MFTLDQCPAGANHQKVHLNTSSLFLLLITIIIIATTTRLWFRRTRLYLRQIVLIYFLQNIDVFSRTFMYFRKSPKRAGTRFQIHTQKQKQSPVCKSGAKMTSCIKQTTSSVLGKILHISGEDMDNICEQSNKKRRVCSPYDHPRMYDARSFLSIEVVCVQHCAVNVIDIHH